MNILEQLRLIYIVPFKFESVVGKYFTVMQNEKGISPVLGVVLMLLLTIVLAGITVSAVYSDDLSASLSSAPMAGIKAESEGSLVYPVNFSKSFIYIEHVGGDPLYVESTKIIINGKGKSYQGVVPTGTWHEGELTVIYENLMSAGKLGKYSTNNPDISDGIWSAGENLILNGPDSINGSPSSTVLVHINGVTDTANNYGLKENSVVTVKVFDIKTQRLIAESECQVSLAG
jgi:flagellin-like protein